MPLFVASSVERLRVSQERGVLDSERHCDSAARTKAKELLVSLLEICGQFCLVWLLDRPRVLEATVDDV